MRGTTRGISRKGTEVSFGSFGLQAREIKWISARQLEACRRVIIRYLRKGGKLWIRVFPDKPITKKGAETPMGGGKGAVEGYVVPIKPGRVLFEIEGISEEMAREAFRKAATKLPIKTKFVTRGEVSL